VMVKFAMVCLPPVLHGFSVTQDRRGYSIIKADSLHTAVGLAAGCPVLPTKMKPQNAVVTPWENSRKPRMRTPTGGAAHGRSLTKAARRPIRPRGGGRDHRILMWHRAMIGRFLGERSTPHIASAPEDG